VGIGEESGCRNEPEARVPVRRPLYGDSAEPHLIASQRSGLVGEDVGCAPKVLNDVAVAGQGALLGSWAAHLRVLVDEDRLQGWRV